MERPRSRDNGRARSRSPRRNRRDASREGPREADRRRERSPRDTGNGRPRDAPRDRSRDKEPRKDRNRSRDSGNPTGKAVVPAFGGKNNPNLQPLGEPAPAPVEKEKPNYGASGLLAAEQNSFKGVVVKYAEPPEARKPTKKWRLYVFKGKEELDMLEIWRQSAYLIGRDRVVADIPVDHQSCSKQHAAIQHRQIVEKNEFGDIKKTTKWDSRSVEWMSTVLTPKCRPYIIDLESTNGVFVNGEQIPAARYFELKEGDVIKFGSSTRDYVLMSEAD